MAWLLVWSLWLGVDVWVRSSEVSSSRVLGAEVSEWVVLVALLALADLVLQGAAMVASALSRSLVFVSLVFVSEVGAALFRVWV